MMVKEIVFPQDTAHRKSWFKAASFSHPAKMNLGLQIYLIEHYTKAGDWILDPMAGSGSILVATAIGRNVICVELEEKFCVMMRQNWEKIKAQGPMLGYPMGTATILQDDSRNLNGLLADCAIFSPPYAEAKQEGHKDKKGYWKRDGKEVIYKGGGDCLANPNQITSDNNIGNLPYGSISTILTSPPHGNRLSDKAQKDNDPQRMSYQQALNKISVACFSPPYEAQLQGSGADAARKRIKEGKYKGLRPDVWISKTNIAGSTFGDGYSKAKDNIGNLKGESYLSAMKIVYENCFSILRDGGLLILVVKNFVRKGQVIRLDSDTIRLCENAGFLLKERLKRRLTQMSFWRTLEKKRWEKQGKQYPEDMSFEHILVFEKK
jgi:16S rRNA G966 N2-methylase RsmD